jgi:hypothetical protein
MNRLITILSVIILLFGCKKSNNEPIPEPTMEYLDLNNVEVKDGVFQRVDLDDNNTQDFTFTTRTVTDATLNQTKFQFIVIARIDAYLLFSGTQTGKKFSKGDSITTVPPAGSTWAPFNLIILAQKITPQSNTPYWDGEWKNASHHYLPVQVTRVDGELYTGWIELSMDVAGEKLILHRAAVSMEPGKNSRAGY